MAAPELRLDVRLNLATFRTDLGKAAQAAAAYYYPINLLVNKQNLTKQLTAIGRSLGTTKYNINLNDTSVVLAADKVEKLAASLKKLSGSIQIDFNAGGGTKPLGTAMREMAAKLAKESKGDINRAVEQMTGMRGASPFGTGTRSIPGFKAAAKGMGLENAFKLFFQELQQVDPQGLKKALDDGSVMMMQENREIKQKFDKIQSSAEGLARDLRAMGETAKATGKASLTAGGKTLYPQNYGLKIASLLGQVEKLDKDLRRVSTESGGELLNTLTELSSVLRTTSNSFVGIAGFSKNLDETLRGFDIATKAATRATTAYADRINRRGGGPAEATAGPRLLSGREPGGALVAPLRDDPYRVIQAQVKNAFDIIEDYHKRQLNNFTSGYKKIIEDYHRKILIQLASVTEYRPSQKLLGGAPPRLALPPAGGASTPERQVRISTGAFVGQPSMMRAPSIPPSMGGGGSPPASPPGGGGGGSFGGMRLNVPQLPGAGVVQELGQEFGFAAKQVLLFGTAYKALAFLQGFPAQVGNAVSALQSFRNTLNAITPSAADAAASNQLIIDTVDKYNIPIESAREGFTRLYASMKPAGFSGEQIGNLFLGISKASATLGLSREKVDRVTYAFSQMASKGQLMAEEVTGQLGDVIPGALSIMAEAANMDIKTFKKAMEDGMFVGKAFETVMSNVPIVLEKRFGKGAEGAAKTFQGALNDMQTSLTLLYEAFEPVAVGFLNAVVKPMTDGLQTITDGFQAFFTGQSAQTAGGGVFAKQLEALRPAFEGIAANIKQILPLLQSFASTALALGQTLLQIAGNPFVGYLARIYLSVLPVTMALRVLNLQVLIPLIGSFLRAIPAFISFNAAMMSGVGTNRALIATMQLTGQTAGVTAGKIRLVSAALATLGSAAILAGIGLLIERFLMMKSAIDGVRQSTQQMLGSISGMANSGAVKELKNVGQDLQKQQATFKELKSFVSGGTIAGGKRLTEAGAKKFEEVGMGSFVAKDVLGKPYIADFLRASEIIEEKLKGLDKQSSKVQEKLPLAAKVAADLARQAQSAQTIASIPEASGDGTGTKPPKEQSLESYYSLQDQLAKNFTQAEINRLQAMHDQRMALQNEFFNQQEARANSFQKESIKFQRELASIENERKSALLKASLEVMQAQGSVAGGAAPMGAATTGKTGLFQGSTGISSGAHFDVRRQDGAYISPEQARALFDPSVRKQLAMTSAYGPRRAPVLGASTFHRGVDLAGPANTPLNLAAGYAMTGAGEKGGLGYAASVRGPQGEMYDVGHLQRPKAGAVAPRKVAGSEKRDLVAAQQVQIANSQQITTGLNAEELAYEKTKTAIANYVASIFSPEEQTLQNSLLAKRGELIRAGMDDDAIELEMKRYEIQQKVNIGLVDAKKALDEKKIGQKEYNDLVAQLNNLLPTSNKLLGEQNALLKDNAYGKRIEDLKEQIRLLLIINTEERRLAELTKEFDGDAIKAQEIFNLEKIKKNIEETRALIDGFVSSTTSDYKGFLKAVISGEDAADALKQFQEGLKDKVLTIFLDFAMAPVEKFLKESLEGLFIRKPEKIPGLDIDKVTTKDPVEATNSNTNATVLNTAALEKVTGALAAAGSTGLSEATINQGFGSIGGASFGGMQLPGLSKVLENIDFETAFEPLQKNFGATLENLSSTLDTNAYSLSQSAVDYSANFKNVGDSANKMAEDAGKAAEDAGRNGKDFQESLGKVASGIGIAAGAIMGIAAGISQIKKGGTGNTLMGIGSIMASVGGAIGGFTKLAGANGGVAGGGWKPFPVSAFANGGMVKGPTLGLVGEGKYNEAIVPLPDGRSIPVQMRGAGGTGSRDLLANQAQSRPSPSVLSMSFQSTTINGVEYVDRAQLEAAMEETRRAASREGASKGANLAIDRLANSPSSRRRAGIR